MLCKNGTELEVIQKNNKWIFQQKIDGVRCLAICFNGNVALKGRNGTDYTKKFPEIVNELKNLNGCFDGEIVCDTFEHTGSRVHTENPLKLKLLATQYPAIFHIFDIVENGILLNRLEKLSGYDFSQFKHISLLPYTFDGVGLLERAKRENWEGLIMKNPISQYSGFCKVRTDNWKKVKLIKSIDLKVIKYEINPAGIRVEDEKGIAIQVSGSNSYSVKRKIDENGFCMIEANYLNLTSSGALRMPVFKCEK